MTDTQFELLISWLVGIGLIIWICTGLKIGMMGFIAGFIRKDIQELIKILKERGP